MSNLVVFKMFWLPKALTLPGEFSQFSCTVCNFKHHILSRHHGTVLPQKSYIIVSFLV